MVGVVVGGGVGEAVGWHLDLPPHVTGQWSRMIGYESFHPQGVLAQVHCEAKPGTAPDLSTRHSVGDRLGTDVGEDGLATAVGGDGGHVGASVGARVGANVGKIVSGAGGVGARAGAGSGAGAEAGVVVRTQIRLKTPDGPVSQESR